MGVGKAAELAPEDRKRIEAAVDSAEDSTGLQFLVFLGKAGRDPHQNALRLLAGQGYDSAPAALLFVAPNRRHVEIVTSAEGSKRLTDQSCAEAIALMRPALTKEDWISGIELGLSALVERAGPDDGSPSNELPDLLT